MVDVLQFHEISEATHWVMNPISLERLELLGEICRIVPGITVLDLACGKGALLGLFAHRFGARGVGVDIHSPFLAEGRRRAHELGVSTKVTFLQGDAGDPATVDGRFDVVSCLGATWIGGGLTGTLGLMRQWLAPGGWLLVGECFWQEQASESASRRHVGGEGFADLGGTLQRFEAVDLDLVQVLISSVEEWDRHEASQWLNVSEWLKSHPEDPAAEEVRAIRDESRRGYLAEDRRRLGWGVFVLRERTT